MAKTKRQRGRSTARQKPAKHPQVAAIRRATALLVVLLVAATVAVYHFGTARFLDARDHERDLLTAVETSIAQAADDIARVEAGSDSSLRAVYDRVAVIDSQIPETGDVVSLATWLSSVSPGVAIGSLTPHDTTSHGTLTGQRVSAQLSGSRDAVLGWFNAVQTERDRLVTVDEVVVTRGEEEWTATAELTAWSAADSLLIAPGEAHQAVDDLDDEVMVGPDTDQLDVPAPATDPSDQPTGDLPEDGTAGVPDPSGEPLEGQPGPADTPEPAEPASPADIPEPAGPDVDAGGDEAPLPDDADGI